MLDGQVTTESSVWFCECEELPRFISQPELLTQISLCQVFFFHL